MSLDRARFSLTHYPLPKNAQGKTFYDKATSYARLRRAFKQTVDDHTVGILWGDPGVGKTTAIRNLIAELPKPDYQVLYVCNTLGSPLDCERSEIHAASTEALVQEVADDADVPLDCAFGGSTPRPHVRRVLARVRVGGGAVEALRNRPRHALCAEVLKHENCRRMPSFAIGSSIVHVRLDDRFIDGADRQSPPSRPSAEIGSDWCPLATSRHAISALRKSIVERIEP